MPKGHPHFFFQFGERERGLYMQFGRTISLSGGEKTMHKSCPCALGDLKIVLAGGSTGQGKLRSEKRV